MGPFRGWGGGFLFFPTPAAAPLLFGQANRVFLNTNDFFRDWVHPKGPGATSWPFTGFGVGFFDFDRDGLLDLYVANGRVKYGATDYDPADPYAEPNQLLKGLAHGE